MTNPPGLPKYRRRKFKSVIQNVRQDASDIIDRFVSQYPSPIVKSVSSIEPYNHQEGYHLHIYFEFQNQIWFHSLLKLLKDLSLNIRIENPGSLPPGQVGRVDLKPWDEGQTWESIIKYLVNPVKDKKVGILKNHRTRYCMCKAGLNKSNICPIYKIPLVRRHIYSPKCERVAQKLALGFKRLAEFHRTGPLPPIPDWLIIPAPPGNFQAA